jgi:hypothetical protein
MFQFNPFTGTLDLNSGPGSYLDDVLEYDNLAAFPVPGESGKIYVARDDNRAYRWPEGGTNHASYREISPLETHTHTSDQVSTTAAYSPDIPQLGGETVFYPDASFALSVGGRPFYRSANNQHILWFNEEIEAWSISEGPLYNLPENILVTADEGDSAPVPWQAAWAYDFLPLSLSGLIDRLLDTFATSSSVSSDKITFQNTLAQKADLIDGTVPAQQLPPLSYQTTRHEGDGTTAAFQPPGVLTEADSPSAISVSVNGVLQEPSVDYTLDIANNRLVLDAPLPAGDKIVITRPLLLPSNTTLTAEQLGAIPASALLAETTARISADRRLLGLTLALS